MQDTKEKISQFLNSSWFISLTTVIALLCYELNIAEITIAYFVLLAAYVFIFENDITPLFIIPIYAPMILDVKFAWSTAVYVIFGMLAVIFIGTLIYFLVRQFKVNKHKFVMGKMFWAGVVVCAVMVIAGVGSANFVYAKWWKQILFPVVLFIFYLFAINFAQKDNKRYIAKLFIGIACFIMLQMLIFLLRSPNPLAVIQSKGIKVGNGNVINTAGTFLALAIPFCFYLANNSKRDWLYCILGFLTYLFLVLTGSRGALLVATLLLPVAFIVSMVKSKEKKRYFIILIIASVVLVAGLVLLIIKRDIVLSMFMKLGFSANGRLPLYNLAWENFLKAPITGTGIYAPKVLPGFSTTVYYYHCTPLMILSCTGVVGLIGFGFYYFKKIKTFFVEASLYKFFAFIALLTIEGYGMIDIHGFMPLMVMLTLILVVTAENEKNPEKFKSVKEELTSFKDDMKELSGEFKIKKKKKETEDVNEEQIDTEIKIEKTKKKTKENNKQ